MPSDIKITVTPRGQTTTETSQKTPGLLMSQHLNPPCDTPTKAVGILSTLSYEYKHQIR